MSSSKLPVKTASVLDTAMKPVSYIGGIPSKYRAYIREKAIDRARTRIVIAGNHPSKLSPQDLEIIVKEEEDKIKGAIKERGLFAVLALLGLNFFG